MIGSGGLWSDDNLLSTLSSYNGSAYNQELPPFRQFCHAAAKIIQRRRASATNTLSEGPVIFILEGLLPASGAAQERRPMFNHGAEGIEGRLWTGASRLSQATGIPIPDGSTADRFDYVISTLGLGDAPAIYYDASQEEGIMRAFPKGLIDPESYEDLSLLSSNLSMEHLRKMFEGAHARLLLTPTSSITRRLWHNRYKSIPIGDAEKGVQEVLHTALVTLLGFGSIVIRQEGTSELGRYDFHFKEQDPVDSSVWTHHAVVELKVIKSFTEAGNPVPDSTNAQAVTDGLKQAVAYRKDQSCRFAALSCYDMRKTPDPQAAITHEQGNAAAWNIGLWAWAMYPSADKARDALVN